MPVDDKVPVTDPGHGKRRQQIATGGGEPHQLPASGATRIGGRNALSNDAAYSASTVPVIERNGIV
jgi:hypothetical protein